MSQLTKKSSRSYNEGFTLIELLLVIAIIGILSSTILASLNEARLKAKIARTQTELDSLLRVAMAQLETDTGKWPNGCPPGKTSNPEVELENPQAGLNQAPIVGDQGDGCEWTAGDIAKWNGPYFNRDTIIDVWGTSYWFDPDYTPYDNCATASSTPEIPAILSYGPNKAGLNAYDCDDIFLDIR